MTRKALAKALSWSIIVVLLPGATSNLPAADQRPYQVQSISIAKMETIIRRSGHCLVVVMAAWCHPCVKELPVLKVLDQKYGREGLRMVGLSVDYGGPQTMEPLLEAQKIRFPVYWTGEAAIEKYAITKIPLLIFFRNGQAVRRLQGQRTRAALEKEIVRFLNNS